jgi:hypothetical protein
MLEILAKAIKRLTDIILSFGFKIILVQHSFHTETRVGLFTFTDFICFV